MPNIEAPCPCGSGNAYQDCCAPYHTGSKQAENALILMRSRYTAYALNLPEYIIQTTHPASPHYHHNLFSWKRGLVKFSKSSSFDQLEIIDHKEHGDFAIVIFVAHLSQNKKDSSFSEKSYFEKVQGRWLYKWGQLIDGKEPNFETIGQIKLLPLAYYGDPILRKQAEEIKEITDEIRKLVEDMIETMDACNALGLSAPQVHHSVQLFVMHKPIIVNDRMELGPVQVIINPKILSSSQEMWEHSEGCVSIPSLDGNVKRSVTIEIEYTKLSGERVKEQFYGWEARVIMHETDHLNGVLFIDHLEKKERQGLEPYLHNLQKRIHDGTEL